MALVRLHSPKHRRHTILFLKSCFEAWFFSCFLVSTFLKVGHITIKIDSNKRLSEQQGRLDHEMRWPGWTFKTLTVRRTSLGKGSCFKVVHNQEVILDRKEAPWVWETDLGLENQFKRKG
jgi:hypothetical protein